MLSHPLCPHDLPSRAQEKQKLAEAAAETLAAASRKPDVISGATARSAPADTAPAVCQVCGAQFLSKTKVCRFLSTLQLTVTMALHQLLRLPMQSNFTMPCQRFHDRTSIMHFAVVCPHQGAGTRCLEGRSRCARQRQKVKAPYQQHRIECQNFLVAAHRMANTLFVYF